MAKKKNTPMYLVALALFLGGLGYLLYSGLGENTAYFLNVSEALAMPQVQQRGMVVDLLHERWGAYRQLGIAPKLSATPGTLRSHAPELGEHTAEILTAIGISESAQHQLKTDGVI